MAVEDDRVAYQAAVQMASYEGNLIWASFRSLLSANAFLIAIAGMILKFFPEIASTHRAIGVAGFILTAAWFLVTMRQFDYYKYWFAWARDREGALGDANKMIRSGKDFADGNSGELHRMRWGSRFFRVEWLIYVVIVIFALLYLRLVSY